MRPGCQGVEGVAARCGEGGWPAARHGGGQRGGTAARRPQSRSITFQRESKRGREGAGGLAGEDAAPRHAAGRRLARWRCRWRCRPQSHARPDAVRDDPVLPTGERRFALRASPALTRRDRDAVDVDCATDYCMHASSGDGEVLAADWSADSNAVR